jgi:hypothetical protein
MSTAYQGKSAIFVKKENIAAMHEHLKSVRGVACESETLDQTLGAFRIATPAFDHDGNITDLFLATNGWSIDCEERFFNEIAEFVEDGSYAIFIIGNEVFAHAYRAGRMEELDVDGIIENAARQRT